MVICHPRNTVSGTEKVEPEGVVYQDTDRVSPTSHVQRDLLVYSHNRTTLQIYCMCLFVIRSSLFFYFVIVHFYPSKN